MCMIPPQVELAELGRQHAKTLRNITTLEMLGREWSDTRNAVKDLTGQLAAIVSIRKSRDWACQRAA
jgi:hypothetical protein